MSMAKIVSSEPEVLLLGPQGLRVRWKYVHCLTKCKFGLSISSVALISFDPPKLGQRDVPSAAAAGLVRRTHRRALSLAVEI